MRGRCRLNPAHNLLVPSTTSTISLVRMLLVQLLIDTVFIQSDATCSPKNYVFHDQKFYNMPISLFVCSVGSMAFNNRGGRFSEGGSWNWLMYGAFTGPL